MSTSSNEKSRSTGIGSQVHVEASVQELIALS